MSQHPKQAPSPSPYPPGKIIKRTNHPGNASDANVAWDKVLPATPPPPREGEK